MGDFLTGWNILFQNWKRIWMKKYSKAVELTQVDWSSGGALAVRTRVFQDIGGFDEKFFMYYEDMDLCYRIHQQGYGQTLWIPEPYIYHQEGASEPDKVSLKRRFFKSQRYYLWKRGWKNLSMVLFILHWIKLTLLSKGNHRADLI
jgi:GT2 family glycosyltransferase